MPCSLRVDGKVHRALVLNLSRGGLFVRTTARARPGARIELDLPLASRGAVPLEARVVWRRVAASTVAALNEGGLGLRISDPPASYDAFVSELFGDLPTPRPATVDDPPASGTDGATATSGDAPALCFEVRVKQRSGPRSRWVRAAGASDADAATAALAQVGDDWEILEIRRAPD